MATAGGDPVPMTVALSNDITLNFAVAFAMAVEEEEAAEEEAPPPEAEEAPLAEGEGGGEEARRRRRGAGRGRVEKAPDMLYTLDVKTGMWTAALLSEDVPGGPPIVEVPDFIADRDARSRASRRWPCRASWRAPCAAPRPFTRTGPSRASRATRRPGGRFTIKIIDGKVYVYGGCTGDEKTWFDDVYELNMPDKRDAHLLVRDPRRPEQGGRGHQRLRHEGRLARQGRRRREPRGGARARHCADARTRADTGLFEKSMTKKVKDMVSDLTTQISKLNT